MMNLIIELIVNTQCSDSTVFHQGLVYKPLISPCMTRLAPGSWTTEHKAIAVGGTCRRFSQDQLI